MVRSDCENVGGAEAASSGGAAAQPRRTAQLNLR